MVRNTNSLRDSVGHLFTTRPVLRLGIAVALALLRGNDTMFSRLLKGFMLVLSTTLMASAFVPLRTPNPPRSLMLLAAGLVTLATVTRRHFADED